MSAKREWEPSYFQILIVDDEQNICKTLELVLKGEGYRTLSTTDPKKALSIVQREVIDVVFLDLYFPDADGHQILKAIKEQTPEVEVIIISGHGSIDDAVKAVKSGAFDFIEKPIQRERLLLTLEQCLHQKWLQRKVEEFRENSLGQFEMVGNSPPIREIFSQIERVAPTDGWVLITGESGTGKELVARAIHKNSPRASRPFVKVNCAAIPDELIESELFGHEKGAFTGAVRTRKGEFEKAHTGTIFLDEIADMSPRAQAKVLRVLNSGELSRVGGDRTIKVDVRVIAATNRDLREEVKRGKFREDLYFRLNVIPIHLPPLRERREDIPLLLEYFLNFYTKKYNLPPKKITPAAMKLLLEYAWPGNVRELKNLTERFVILGGDEIDVSELPDYIKRERSILDIKNMGNKTLKELREEVERSYILSKLEENNWNISKTAEELGIERTNLHKKIKNYGIQRPTGSRN